MSGTLENKSDMSRRAAREQAFSLVFEKAFHQDYTVGDIILNATDADDMTVDEFALGEVEGVFANIDEIDALISKHLRGWTIQRISKVTLAILRLAVYEMRFSDLVPESVAINEAVELAKKFGNDDDPAYINGVLGTISRS